MTTDEDSAALELAITEAALTLIEEAGAVSHAALLEQFPSQDEIIEAVLEALGVYETQVRSDREIVHGSAALEVLEPGTLLGEYEILGELGRGGMGIVYRARQSSLGGRELALKVLPPALVAKDPRFLGRFRREAALAAEIHDARVAEVFGYGEEGGLVFFAMQLVEGRPMDRVLKELARERRLGSSRHQIREYVESVAELVRTLARGVSALHERGLVHRDIKPSNVVLEGLQDAKSIELFETLTEARPVLIDFGLMRPVTESEMTGSQTMMGTTGFASPEARLGREVDARADVFALGAILHDLLALTSPGDRDPATAGLSDVRTLNPAVDERLAAIVRMALDERRELRYADGGALADELERYVAGRSVAALPTTPWRRLKLWMRRDTAHALAVLMGIGVAFVALLVLTLGVVSAIGAAGAARYVQQGLEDGELAEAADGLREVISRRGVLGWLPGYGNELELAAELERLKAERLADDLAGRTEPPGEMSLAEVLLHLDAGGRNEMQAAHDRVLMLLLTPGYDVLSPTLLAFITRELSPDRPAWRRRMAAESAAQVTVCQPVTVETDKKLPVEYAELAAALQRTIREAGETETRRFCISALSGLCSNSVLSELIAWPQEDDIECRNLWMLALKRSVLLQYNMSGSVPCELLASCARAAWRTLLDPKLYTADPIHSGRLFPAKGWAFNGRYFSDARSDVTGGAFEIIGTFAALRYADLHSKDAELVARQAAIELPEGLQRVVDDIIACRVAEDRGQPLPPPWSVADAIVEASSSSDFPEAAVRAIIRESTVYQANNFRMALAGKHAYSFENIWDQSLSPLTGELEADQPDTSHARGALTFESGTPQLRGAAISARWSGAAQEPPRDDASGGYFEFRIPRHAWLELTLAIPEGADRALVRLSHRKAGRNVLPFTGQGEVRVSFNGVSTKILRMTGASISGERIRKLSDKRVEELVEGLRDLHFDDEIDPLLTPHRAKSYGIERVSVQPDDPILVRPSDLIGFDKLVIRYELSRGSSLVWLEAIEVLFDGVEIPKRALGTPPPSSED
jgi:serine/threonine protein kinase